MTFPADKPAAEGNRERAAAESEKLVLNPGAVLVLGVTLLVIGFIIGFVPHGGYGSALGGHDIGGSVSDSITSYQLVMATPTTWTWLFLGAGVFVLIATMHAALVRQARR